MGGRPGKVRGGMGGNLIGSPEDRVLCPEDSITYEYCLWADEYLKTPDEEKEGYIQGLLGERGVNQTPDNLEKYREKYKNILEHYSKELSAKLAESGCLETEEVDGVGLVCKMNDRGLMFLNELRKKKEEDREAIARQIAGDKGSELLNSVRELEDYMKTQGFDDIYIRKRKNGTPEAVFVKKEAKRSTRDVKVCAPADATGEHVHLGLKRLVIKKEDGRPTLIDVAVDEKGSAKHEVENKYRDPDVHELNQLFGWETGPLNQHKANLMGYGYEGVCRSETGRENEALFLYRFAVPRDCDIARFTPLAVHLTQKELEALASVAATQLGPSSICWQSGSDGGLSSSTHVYFNGRWQFPNNPDFIRNLVGVLRDEGTSIPGIDQKRREEIAGDLENIVGAQLEQLEAVSKQFVHGMILTLTGTLPLLAFFYYQYRKTMKAFAEEKFGGDPLELFGEDLTRRAAEGRLDKMDPSLREGEIREIRQALLQLRSAILTGEAGVGKTAVVEALAEEIAAGRIRELKGVRIISLDLNRMEAGTKYRGTFEERLDALVRTVMQATKDGKRVVLFIDEIHRLIGTGRAEGAVGAAQVLKPYLAHGDLIVIGATTDDEFRYITSDPALEQRFKEIKVRPLSQKGTFQALKARLSGISSYRSGDKEVNIEVSDEVLEKIVEVSERLEKGAQPRKACNVLREILAWKALEVFEGEKVPRTIQLTADDVDRYLRDAKGIDIPKEDRIDSEGRKGRASRGADSGGDISEPQADSSDGTSETRKGGDADKGRLGIVSDSALGLPRDARLPETFGELGRGLVSAAGNIGKQGAVFLAGEYISEALLAAANGDWSKLQHISAVQVIKDFGALSLGGQMGVAVDNLLFETFPSVARIPGARSASSRFFPLFAAIMVLNMARGNKPALSSTLLSMGNIALAQGVTRGATKLFRAIRYIRGGVSAVANGAKMAGAGTGDLPALVLTTAAEFVIIKLLGEAEGYIFGKMAIRDAKKVLARLVSKNNELIARMQRDPEGVDAAELIQVQLALAELQEEVAKMRHMEAYQGVEEEIARLEERKKGLSVYDFLRFGWRTEEEKLERMREARERYDAEVARIDREIMHLRFRSEGRANGAGSRYIKLHIPNDGVATESSEDSFADTWTALSNQLQDYIERQNLELNAIAAKHASNPTAMR